MQHIWYAIIERDHTRQTSLVSPSYAVSASSYPTTSLSALWTKRGGGIGHVVMPGLEPSLSRDSSLSSPAANCGVDRRQ